MISSCSRNVRRFQRPRSPLAFYLGGTITKTLLYKHVRCPFRGTTSFIWLRLQPRLKEGDSTRAPIYANAAAAAAAKRRRSVRLLNSRSLHGGTGENDGNSVISILRQRQPLSREMNHPVGTSFVLERLTFRQLGGKYTPLRATFILCRPFRGCCRNGHSPNSSQRTQPRWTYRTYDSIGRVVNSLLLQVVRAAG